jgi:hypothetical protein
VLTTFMATESLSAALNAAVRVGFSWHHNSELFARHRLTLYSAGLLPTHFAYFVCVSHCSLWGHWKSRHGGYTLVPSDPPQQFPAYTQAS